MQISCNYNLLVCAFRDVEIVMSRKHCITIEVQFTKIVFDGFRTLFTNNFTCLLMDRYEKLLIRKQGWKERKGFINNRMGVHGLM